MKQNGVPGVVGQSVLKELSLRNVVERASAAEKQILFPCNYVAVRAFKNNFAALVTVQVGLCNTIGVFTISLLQIFMNDMILYKAVTIRLIICF